MKRVVFYANQFFGQIGGEEQTNLPPLMKEAAVGPAVEIQKELREAVIVATILCGDNYYVQHMDEARTTIMNMLERLQPDLVIAGPAFNAGRLGIACGDVCASVAEKFHIPALTGMYLENPAVELYRHRTIIIKTGKTAASMREALTAMTALANDLLQGKLLPAPEIAGIFSKGVRENVFKEKTGAQRALDMLVAKLSGQPFETEIPLPTYDRVDPAKGVTDLSRATIALVTSGGIVPENNPDRLPAATAKHYCVYDISTIDSLQEGAYESVHAGYDPVAANLNPNRIVPIDIMRELEHSGRIGKLHPSFYSTTGNSTSVADATRMGKEIAADLKQQRVDAVIMTST
jgi:glycine reductase complex component B subunit gamma